MQTLKYEHVYMVLPHVRQIDMKVKIHKNFELHKAWEVQDFMRNTSNFTKKFYTLEACRLDHEVPILQYHAVALSRDVIYDTWFVIDCKHMKSGHTPVSPTDEWTQPPYDIIPSDDYVCDVLFPRRHEKDSVLEYVNIFEQNNFLRVQTIDFEK